MAIFRPSAIIQSISGSLQAITYKQTRYGQVIAQRLRRVHKASPTIHSAQAQWTTLSTAWSDLTITQRQAWASFARHLTTLNRLALPRAPSARGLFLSHNAPAFSLGIPIITDPPHYTHLPAISNASLVWQIPVWYNSRWTTTGPLSPIYTIVEGSRPLHSRVPGPPRGLGTPPPWIFRRWRTLHIHSGPTGFTSINIYASWSPIMGDCAHLEQTALRLRTWHPDALESPRLIVTTSVGLWP